VNINFIKNTGMNINCADGEVSWKWVILIMAKVLQSHEVKYILCKYLLPINYIRYYSMYKLS
jgi:hypothetical protein